MKMTEKMFSVPYLICSQMIAQSLVKPVIYRKYPSCPVAIVFPAPQSGSVQTETAGFSPVSITAAEDQHYLEQHALAEKGTVDLISDTVLRKMFSH